MFGHAWIGMPTFLAGSLLPVLRTPVAWTVFAGIVASIACSRRCSA
jgi:two-component system sensor histidine kinase DesK